MATQKVVVGGSTVSASQLKDLMRQIEDGSLNGIHMQAVLEHRNPFDLDNVVIDWAKVYEVLGMKEQFEKAKFSTEPTPNFWDVCVVKGVTPNMVVKALRDLGVDVYLYIDDLDKDVSKNDRDPAKGSYRVRFQKTVEADPELKNKSANDLATEGVKGITLLERLLLELGYFLATGNHLDAENVTLCSGSRGSGGGVPRVYWNSDGRKVYVRWCYPDYRDGNLRSRAVVS